MVEFTEIENVIMHKLNYRISNNEKVTLTMLSDECHVAKSTVVKFAKKLGYSGFIEMYYQMKEQYRAKNMAEFTFADSIVDGDIHEVLHELTKLLYTHRHAKNFVNAYNRDDMLSSYVARKLMMFDIFAPSTYDFAMVKNPYLTKGMALFIDLRSNRPFVVKDIMKLSKEQGYFIVAFSDEKLDWAKEYVGYFVKIKKTEFFNTNFFEAKVIMLMEMLLSEYSRRYYVDIEEQ